MMVFSVEPDRYRSEVRGFRAFLNRKGYKSAFKHVKAEDSASGSDGVILTIVDPLDCEVTFARFYTYDELSIIRHSCAIFWRFV